jgi:hypothetical protein
MKAVRLRSRRLGATDALGSQRRFLRKRDQTMILDIAQIALPEIGQKIQRKFSSAKVSI